MLATSREPLAVQGEHVWSVEPLSTADGVDDIDPEPTGIPAVALFVERARAADPSFVLDEHDRAGRHRDMSPARRHPARDRARGGAGTHARRRRDRRRLDERFGLLKAMRRGSDPRHRAMHDTISWSYDLLEPDEQELFTTLSVFAGSFDLTAAGRMCTVRRRARSADAAGGAIDADGTPRCRWRSPLRASRNSPRLRPQRLGDERAAEIYTDHASHFAAEAAVVARDLHGPAELVGVERAESSFADFRSAQRFALDVGALDDAFGIIASLRDFAMRAMRYEVFAWAGPRSACPVVWTTRSRRR